MRITVLLDRARLFGWHLAVIEALRSAGHAVCIRFRETQEPLPTSLTAILDFDRARGHTSSDRFSTHLKPLDFETHDDLTGPPSAITLDLSSASTIQRLAGPVVRPVYDGSPKDYALFHALLDRHGPHLTLWHSEYPSPFDIGTPALDTPSRLATSLDQTTSRLVEGIVRFFRSSPERFPVAATASVLRPKDTESSILSSARGFLTARTLRKARRMSDMFSGNAPRWHVAWRALTDSVPVAPGTLHLPDYRVLADDSERCYSNPFILEHDGAAHVFVAELAEATGVSVISHVVLGAGKNQTPQPVLKSASHLGYPFVFERDGHVWMMPGQSSGAGLDLYRCTDFPGTWVRECRLIDECIHNATLFEHSGLLWIAAGCQAFQSSASDGLALFWADALTGPWHPHALNPVVVDAHSARPAGALWRAGGQLYRPSQDCSGQDWSDQESSGPDYPGGVARALTVNRITGLTRDTFAEVTAGALSFPRNQHLLGPHAIGRGAGIEVIDLYARPSAIRAAFRAGFRAEIRL